ncbi:hypothetical protein Taro_044033, partial [Colocasia esculenta]|nr:hypothetical protein [Colocasia esculenta]
MFSRGALCRHLTIVFYNPFLGAVRGGTGVCSSLTSWRVRGSRWFYLWDLNLEEVLGGRGCGETLFSPSCSVSLVVTPGCSFLISWRSGMLVRAEGLLPHCVDSAGSAGVVSGPTLVVGRGFTLFRCFVLLMLSLELLLLWLVRDWLSLLSLVREAHLLLSPGRDSLSQEFIARRLWWRFVAPCVANSVSCERERLFRSESRVAFLQVLGVFGSMGGGTTFRVSGGGSERSGRYSGIRAQGSNEICNELITMAVLKKGTSTLLARLCRITVRTVPCPLLSVAVLPHSLRCAVCLAGAFWRVFLERCLGSSGGGSPKTCLRCFCSSACCSVFSDGLCCWPFGLCVLVKVLPRIAPLLILAEVLPRSAQCSFWATVVLPLWFEVCRLVGLRSGEVLPGRLLALLVEVLHRAALCLFWSSLLFLSVEMSCRCCRLDRLCDSLLGCCRPRCGAVDHVSGRGAGQEFIVGWLWWQFVASCVASSVSCECERLFRSESRVAFLQVLG